MWRRTGRLASGRSREAARVTASASTPRLRITLLWYLALVVAAGFNGSGVLLDWPASVRVSVALLLVGISVLGRIWCSAFIAGRKDAELVTVGPYSACRHPLYALSLVGGAGAGIASGSLVMTGATLLLLGLLFGRAIPAEEALLEREHGDAFRAYVRRTPRLWPDWANYAVPDRIELRARVYWKAFVDGGSALLLLALIASAAACREGAGLPALLHLP
jgi:protein-S-isoprenylcysteine O-methyltransferase Ste14